MKPLDRRTFLKSVGVAASLPLVGTPEHSGDLSTKMVTRAIPTSGEKLPIVGLGTWQQFDVDSSSKESTQLLQVLQSLQKMGGKVIDSSPMYGRSEAMVGTLTQKSGLAEDFFYATKVWTTGKDQGIQQMHESLARMGRTTMDLMQVHNLIDVETHLKTLFEWKKENKVRYVGATHYSSAAHVDLERLITRHKIDFLQFNYNILHPNAAKSLLPRAMDAGVAVLINEPFASGQLFQKVKGKALPEWSSEWGIDTWAKYFLKYILSHPAVTCVIPGTSNPKHALDNMGAGFGKLPDETGRKKMADYFASL
jgi:diketogulonate reductase-like aldo/keto reductase